MKKLNSIQRMPGKLLLLVAVLFFAGKTKAQCNANFTYMAGSNGLIQFMATSPNPGPNTMHTWYFGDGQVSYDTLTTMNHTYGLAGIYVVTHYISDSAGCAATVIDTININNLPCAAPVSFIVDRDSIQTLTWHVYPNYPMNIVSATWSWGDGSISTGWYPSHTYSVAGTYSICVTVSVSCGITDTFCLSPYIYRSSQSSNVISIDVVGATPTGIGSNSIERLDASVYPNPAAAGAKLKFYSPDAASYKLSILAVDGRQLMSELVQAAPGENTAELRTENLQSGLYFISLSHGKAQKTIRLVKE
jgi:PKD repeat protein